MSEGIRGLLAPWIGGASDGTVAPAQGGYRSLLAFWTGGATSFTPAATQGYRSLLAFWAGGAANSGIVVPPALEEEVTGGWPIYLPGRRRKLKEQIEVLQEQVREVIASTEQTSPVTQRKILRSKRWLAKTYQERERLLTEIAILERELYDEEIAMLLMAAIA